MFYAFSSTVKFISMTHDYIERSGVKVNPDKLNIKNLIDFFNQGFPLPQININLQEKILYGKNSQEMVHFINELMSKTSDLVVDLYGGELLHKSSVGIDELYVVPVHYMFDNINLIKYERTLDIPKNIIDNIDSLVAKFNRFPIVVNELRETKKGTF